MVFVSEIEETTPVSPSNSSIAVHRSSNRRRSTPYAAAAADDDDRDHLSELPDTVLTHVLSYLDTKTSVATSLLSKRWNHLWTSVPNLDLGNSVCFRPGRLSNYLDFVDRVLSLNNVLSVRKLRLYCRKVSQCDAWMTSIAKRNFEEIDLRFYTNEMFRVPDSFFNQKYLVELKLELYTKVPQMVCFPCLETIHLYDMRLRDDDSMKNLLSGCPVLRNLYLELGGWEDASTLYICSSTLHVLHLNTKEWNGEDYVNVVINAPNVIDFHLVNIVGVRYYKVDVPSVVKLYLACYMRNQMSLELLTNLPMFQNLIHLTLDIANYGKWPWVPQLLDRTPSLVSFALVSGDFAHCQWYEPDEVPHCILSCLESVKITILFSENCREEVMMISYILKNANVLKKLSIHDKYYTPAKKSAFVKTLLTMPRSSTSCQVYYQDVAII